MPRDRFFVAGARTAGDRIALAPDDARKLVTVLRRQTGDRVAIVDSAGIAFTARLEIDGKTVHAILDAPAAESAPSPASRIVVAQAIPKGQKMDFIVEKATELGAAAIVPLRSERVVGDRTGENKRERWQRIAKTAAQQSGAPRVPVVEPVADWSALIATFEEYARVYIAWEDAAVEPLRTTFASQTSGSDPVLIIIGPEGGFSRAEVARAQRAGALAISLGKRILRTETAALVVLAALLYARGEL